MHRKPVLTAHVGDEPLAGWLDGRARHRDGLVHTRRCLRGSRDDTGNGNDHIEMIMIVIISPLLV